MIPISKHSPHHSYLVLFSCLISSPLLIFSHYMASNNISVFTCPRFVHSWIVLRRFFPRNLVLMTGSHCFMNTNKRRP